MPRNVDLLEVERKWEKIWQDWGIYKYDWSDAERPKFSIDTPPPYPSGDFHMGNVLNWTYFDIVARYKRMRGFNVHFPQGWDCHGLPTEVAVEKAYKIRRSDVPPDRFRKLCEEWIEQYINLMKTAVMRLGCSVDWDLEYRTMDPEYMKKIQLSFIMLYEKGLIYKSEHPINWCPRCETAIADAEVEHTNCIGNLYTISFGLEGGGEILIATSRPEYIPACVAIGVNPEDGRYNHLIGGNSIAPITGKIVPIIADEAVDPEFGTGIMMTCTFGDKADVQAVAKFNLPTVKLVDEKGRMTGNAGGYAGLTVEEARKKIVGDLEELGLLKSVENLEQEVGTCWRCDTPIEIISTEQWFMKTKIFTEEIERTAKEIRWYPDWMKHRLIDWARSLDWDWVLSRQRVFATPIPVWYCTRCGTLRVAKPEELPVDPRTVKPRGGCLECGSLDFKPETSVLDTWFDSSLTCAIHAGWPERKEWTDLFPASIHPSGQDIIRTWAYYLMVRHLALFGKTAYNSVLINGMVLGADGRKMSKSLGNFVTSKEVFERYGADAARQWAAAGGNTGFDVPFRWSDVEFGWKFMRKLWNACRFASVHLQDFNPEGEVKLEILDQWILSMLERVVKASSDALEECQFMNALETARNFIWHVFCDQYLEAIKHRLYADDEGKRAAQWSLYYGIKKMLQLLAPVMPSITEEIYSYLYSNGERDSIHISRWPEQNDSLINSEAEKVGDIIVSVMKEVRRLKNRQGIPLNAEMERVSIYCKEDAEMAALKLGLKDISATLNIKKVELFKGSGGASTVEDYPNISLSI